MGEIWNGLLSGLGSVLSFFYDIIPSYGVAIILLTIFVRILLLPLTIKQTKSMQGMQKIQPRVKELQRKFVGQLASGACLDFAVNYQRIVETKGVPRHSH